MQVETAQLTAVATPEDKRLEMIKSVIEEVRPNLRRDGGDCELVSVEGSKISVKLTGACVLCKLSSAKSSASSCVWFRFRWDSKARTERRPCRL